MRQRGGAPTPNPMPHFFFIELFLIAVGLARMCRIFAVESRDSAAESERSQRSVSNFAEAFQPPKWTPKVTVQCRTVPCRAVWTLVWMSSPVDVVCNEVLAIIFGHVGMICSTTAACSVPAVCCRWRAVCRGMANPPHFHLRFKLKEDAQRTIDTYGWLSLFYKKLIFNL